VIFSKNGFVEVRTNFNMDGSKSKKKMNNITLEDTIDAFTMMGAIETNNQSQEFKGGKATVVMGGIDLDLRDAVLYNNEAFLELNVIMGGIEIYVPSDWRVEVTGVPLLGAWENKARNNVDPNAPILKIKCFILMGGIDVN
jgi:predicted membrane protein